MATNRLDKVYSLGDDQRANQFYVRFDSAIPGSSLDPEKIALRLDQAIDIPEQTIGEYEFFFRGFKITRTSKVEDTDKHLSMTVRLDQNLEVLDALRAWQKLTFNPAEGTWTAIDAGVTCDLSVVLVKSDDSPSKVIRLRKCILKNLQLLTLDPASQDPSRATMNLIVGEFVI